MRRIKIVLTYPTADVPVNNQHFMNGYIFNSFGKDCPFHDTFSPYNISSLQNGTLKDDKKTLEFKNGNPYFYVSGDDSFIEFAINAFETSTASVFGMKFDSIDVFDDFVVNKRFDKIVTISPIIVKTKEGRKVHLIDYKAQTIDGIPYVINSNCKAISDPSTNAGDYCIAYGALDNYEVPIFSPVEVAKSNDYKFRDGIVCYKSSVFTGGNVVGYNGFLRIKKGQAAS